MSLELIVHLKEILAILGCGMFLGIILTKLVEIAVTVVM